MIVAIDDARNLDSSTSHPKRSSTIAGTDHLLRNTSDAHVYATSLAA